MIQYSYEKIFKIAKRIRGFNLDDFPCNLQEIMQAFDNRQNITANAVQIATQLLDDTQLWIRILENHEGRGSPKYIVASNKIANTSIDILNNMVESTCSKVSENDLQPHISHVLSSRINELLNVLTQIERLCIVPETHKAYKDMVKKLVTAQEQVEALVVSH